MLFDQNTYSKVQKSENYLEMARLAKRWSILIMTGTVVKTCSGPLADSHLNKGFFYKGYFGQNEKRSISMYF